VDLPGSRNFTLAIFNWLRQQQLALPLLRHLRSLAWTSITCMQINKEKWQDKQILILTTSFRRILPCRVPMLYQEPSFMVVFILSELQTELIPTPREANMTLTWTKSWAVTNLNLLAEGKTIIPSKACRIHPPTAIRVLRHKWQRRLLQIFTKSSTVHLLQAATQNNKYLAALRNSLIFKYSRKNMRLLWSAMIFRVPGQGTNSWIRQQIKHYQNLPL
jgi:hypothetical protein